MTLATIMVNVDFDEDTEDRIAVAAGLASQFNSLLIGVAGWPVRQDPTADSAAEFPATEEIRLKRILEELERLGEKFRRSAGTNPRGVEWRSSAHFPNEVIAAQARAADLVVIGRNELPGDVYRTFDPGAVILAAGRPVLVLPRGLRRLQAFRVMIAWKNTREGRRAVSDALPFLKEAQSVCVAAVSSQGMETSVRDEIADVAAYLERHRVSVGEQIAVAAVDEAQGDVLLRIAKQQNSDLIVAGAYGRTRLSEWIFGGVSRHLLMSSTVPCLFSN